MLRAALFIFIYTHDTLSAIIILVFQTQFYILNGPWLSIDFS